MSSIIEKIKNKRPVLLCPHCGNTAPQQVEYAHEFEYTEVIGPEEEDEVSIPAYYFLVVCATCSKVSLYSNWDVADDPFDLRLATLFYPTTKKFSSVIPKRISKAYQEASRISRVAPNAFACMVRRALEFMCEDKKAVGRTLHDKLQDLSSKNIIPPVLAEMADIVKKLGNIGAHADETNVHREDVEVIDDFFNAVIEYVYVAPEKINKIKKKLTKKP